MLIKFEQKVYVISIWKLVCISRISICAHTQVVRPWFFQVIASLIVLSSFKGPNCSDWKQPMYLGFEKDVFKTIADYYGHLKEPLLTFHLFDAFVSVLGRYIAMYLHVDTKSSVSRVPLIRAQNIIFYF